METKELKLQSYRVDKKIKFFQEKPDMILTCGNCASKTFYISEKGCVACTECRYLMEPTPWISQK